MYGLPKNAIIPWYQYVNQIIYSLFFSFKTNHLNCNTMHSQELLTVEY